MKLLLFTLLFIQSGFAQERLEMSPEKEKILEQMREVRKEAVKPITPKYSDPADGWEEEKGLIKKRNDEARKRAEEEQRKFEELVRQKKLIEEREQKRRDEELQQKKREEDEVQKQKLLEQQRRETLEREAQEKKHQAEVLKAEEARRAAKRLAEENERKGRDQREAAERAEKARQESVQKIIEELKTKKLGETTKKPAAPPAPQPTPTPKAAPAPEMELGVMAVVADPTFTCDTDKFYGVYHGSSVGRKKGDVVSEFGKSITCPEAMKRCSVLKISRPESKVTCSWRNSTRPVGRGE